MSELPQSIRTFIAINLPAEVLARIGQVQAELKPAVRSGVVRWTTAEQTHLTLKFLGAIASASRPELEAALRRACASVDPFELRAKGLGGFPQLQRPRVLWVGIECELNALYALQESILRETGAWGDSEEREFRAHLTIGRIKNCAPGGLRNLVAKMESLPSPEFGRWRVAAVHLMRSELSSVGARYTCLASIPLGTVA